MELTILQVLDETPRGLTTGFRLKLCCQVAGHPPFQLDLPIRASREAVERQIPLINVVLAYLKSQGLDSYPDLFVDTRRLDVAALGTSPPQFPMTFPLGGNDLLAQRAVAALARPKT